MTPGNVLPFVAREPGQGELDTALEASKALTLAVAAIQARFRFSAGEMDAYLTAMLVRRALGAGASTAEIMAAVLDTIEKLGAGA